MKLYYSSLEDKKQLSLVLEWLKQESRINSRLYPSYSVEFIDIDQELPDVFSTAPFIAENPFPSGLKNVIEFLTFQYATILPDQYPGYLITRFGDIFSIRKKLNKLKKYMQKGYTRVRLLNPKTHKYNGILVHRLLASAFLPRPSTKSTRVTFLDDSPDNYFLNNLTWSTVSSIRKKAYSRQALSTEKTAIYTSNLTTSDYYEHRGTLPLRT